jgi:hypothetical protein
MGRWAWILVLAALLEPAAVSQDVPPETDPNYQMEMRMRELKLQEHEAKLEFQRRMEELELRAKEQQLERENRPEGGGLAILLLGCLVVHILVAVWIYQDSRQRGVGSGIWIILGLLGGLLAALVYAIVRLGDISREKVVAA